MSHSVSSSPGSTVTPNETSPSGSNTVNGCPARSRSSSARHCCSSGNVSAGAGDGAAATHEATFTIKILEGGDGVLKFSGGEYKGPQIDYIVITKAG